MKRDSKSRSASAEATLEKARTADEIFLDMHRELRAWNQDVPESPERMDPVLRIMLKLYASQLAAIDRKITHTWKSASNALVQALCPENMRWPVPAFTVMQTEPSDPVVHVDPRSQFFYKEERESGETFFFSSVRTEKILKAALKRIYFATGDNVLDLSPMQPGDTRISSRHGPASFSGRQAAVYLAVEHEGPGEDFEGCLAFLQGSDQVLRQLRWAGWLPGIGGDFDSGRRFCPGATAALDDIFSSGQEPIEWGGLRKSSDLFASLENNFVVIPKDFAHAWRAGSPDAELAGMMNSAGIAVPEGEKNLYWIKVVLPTGGDRAAFQSSFRMHFDCFLAVNKYERTLFKHTGGNRLVEIEIPEHSDGVLEIISVTDSSGNSYVPRHRALTAGENRFYALFEQRDRLCLWFDFSGGIELPPDSITVNYSITAGPAANGISAGKINELYQSHPGIVAVKNLVPAAGAIPARTEEQVMTEISARLRGRDRAMSFDQIVNWVKIFDKRIQRVECEKGVMRTDNGVSRCVVVRASVREKEFFSDDEIELLRTRLGSFLKARTSINSRFQLEIAKV